MCSFKPGTKTAHALGSRKRREPVIHAYLPRYKRQVLRAGRVNSSHSIDSRPSRKVVTTTVKATTCRIYHKSRRERKEKGRDKHSSQHPTAQRLPDDVLLEIFSRHRQAAIEYGAWKWHRLAQVCRRWRSVVFAYPRHLDLRIVLTYNKTIRDTPKFWPVLPIIIWYPHPTASQILTPSDEDNLSDILKNPTRICEMHLDITRPLLAKFASLLEESFPALDHLRLRQSPMNAIVLPDDFLAGSAPRLRVLHLRGITISMLPRFLSSSTNLVSLRLENITRNGCFAPEDFVIGLSTATQLKNLELRFDLFAITPLSPILEGPSPSRIVLPSLTGFRYEGESTYLKCFVSGIDAPIIEQISLTFFFDSSYDTHELCDLFGIGDALRSSPCPTTYIRLSKYHMVFSHHFARNPSSPPGLFRLQHPYQTYPPAPPLVIQVCCKLGSQDVLPKVTHLEIEDCPETLRRFPTCWLNLFRALTGLKTLHVAGKLAPIIASALAEINEENIREILPALQELHFGTETPSPTSSFIMPFINGRQLCGLPVSMDFRKLDWSSD